MSEQQAPGRRARWRDLWANRRRSLWPSLFTETAPIDLSILGRTLWRAALVGVCAGLVGAAFFAGVEALQELLLEGFAGYSPLRAHGEATAHLGGDPGVFRPWLLLLLPAIGGLGCGLLTRLAPETRGGGSDAMIEAFHHRGGAIRRRVIWIKSLASACTLGTGGAGGREGPVMLVGGALGSMVGRLLGVSQRERRILLVAGVAAGIAAVFRTPLGAAILAVEVLYKDGFESDALIPSVLASVVSYSIVISIFGESTLFATAEGYPFDPAQLPLYALMAVLLSAAAVGFLATYRAMKRLAAALPGPEWIRPAVGGLALGVLVTPIIILVSASLGSGGQGLGLLGGGYGGAQVAITGADWLPGGWNAVGLLCLLAAAKLLATSLTLGSGGSAGDFAPSMAMGALLGGAFGRAAQIALNNPSIDPGAFALVGMGVFFGGIAHVPLASLVLVCEMAGNYDLLVPLMLALAISFVALRRHNLYGGQVATMEESPAHRDALLLESFKATRAADLVRERPYATFSPNTPAAEMLETVSESTWQDVFPVIDKTGALRGLVSADGLRVLSGEREQVMWAVAADVMQPPVTVRPDDDLRCVTERLIRHKLRELPVVDRDGQILGFLDEAEITRAQLRAAARAEASALSSPAISLPDSSRTDLARAETELARGQTGLPRAQTDPARAKTELARGQTDPARAKTDIAGKASS